jgi:hypothetical protein
MIFVHPNGDLTIPGPRISLSMYRGEGEHYEPAFDAPCDLRAYVSRFKGWRPAFYWVCRVQGRTTSISACRECPVTDGEKANYRELAREKNAAYARRQDGHS